MPIKFKVKDRAELPAELATHYVERDGAWQLDVEGAVDRAKLEEFRTNNIALLKERDDLRQKYADIQPEEVQTLREEKRRLEEAQQIKAGEFEKVLETRLRTVKTDWDKRLAGVTTERDQLTARLSAIQIDQAVVAEATRRGLRPTAIPDVTARARNTFRLQNGVPQAMDTDGQTPRTGRDGITPLSVSEWIDQQVADAPHLFEANAGSGAGGSAAAAYGNGPGGTGTHTTKNPFRRETWNLTEQMKLTKTDPGLAARLKAAA